MRIIGKCFAVGFAVLAIGVVAMWVTSPDPQHNPASFEDEPLEMRLAPLEEAITLAQFRDEEGRTRTMIVRDMKGGVVTGVDLEKLGASRTDDPFEALAAADISRLQANQQADQLTFTINVDELLPSGSGGTSHIGTGTNFPEHAEEANSSAVFQFPKFGAASAARAQVRTAPGILLDYEVELCIRFDRDLTAPEQFDEAIKGFFLCGDFTNRNALIELADPDNLDSGSGFSDAKSGPDFFPTGPFLVVPNDWKAFISSVRMTTSVNESNRQDARGSEMTLDFKGLVEKAFTDTERARFLYRDGYVKLTSTGTIPSSTTVMSGTAEGTIFTPPTRGDIIEALAAYLARGGPLGEESFLGVARRTFIANEVAGKHYLQPGDVVHHGSNYLGDIVVVVVD